ncbi:MAG: heat-inducible transcription repressor HrcA [Myxococcales bacterium]|nr:heat-inducible transcription repressor HrcA [Myxococcales bacterium]
MRGQAIAIDGRPREVLHAAVERYIASAEPVASAVLSRPLRLSSALIRSIMMGLEDRGLLQQPHTSAGRIPTDRGYRFYVDELHTGIAAAEAPNLLLVNAAREGLRTLMQAALAALTAQTQLTAFAIAATREEELHHHIEFVRLDAERLLAVHLSSTGVVRRRVFTPPIPATDAQLEQFRNLLNERYRGLSLKQIRERLAAELTVLRAGDANDGDDRATTKQALDFGDQAFPGGSEPALDVAVAGQHHLLGQPEFRLGTSAARVLEELERRETWLRLLDAMTSDAGAHSLLDTGGMLASAGGSASPLHHGSGHVSVFIGRESGVDGLSDCAIVMAPIDWDADHSGSVGLVGPMRMAYAAMMATVELLRNHLSRARAVGAGHLDLTHTSRPPLC